MQLAFERSIIRCTNLSQERQEMEHVIQRLRQFRDERNWQQFHNPKDLAVALSIEASELLEVFLWKAPDAADPEKVKEELADVLAYALLLSDAYKFDIEKIILEKIERNEEKYPVHKAKGTAKKYNEL
ncbi:NTP pyrophosphatase (non-canonical NTP hydrolase) [Achromobacter deleyi]|nr:nucleotide pyrophosphohydrolase [Achromobacter deleyi]MDR6602208.1 NTP pyrophosphatase (non-canonical NTP hydrolase) [Achromobacter deleyi]